MVHPYLEWEFITGKLVHLSIGYPTAVCSAALPPTMWFSASETLASLVGLNDR